MKLTMIKGIFFDLDGTIFDTQWDLLDVFTRIFTDAGIPFDPANLKIGPPLTEYMKMVKPEITQQEIDAVIAQFRIYYDRSDFPKTVLYPGIREMLEKFAAAGRLLFMVTNKRIAPTQKIVELKDVGTYFRAVCGCDSFPGRKKSDNIRALMAENGLEPAECVMVGDTKLDVAAGHDAGIRAIGVTWGYDTDGELAASGPDAVVNTADELIELVEAM